MFSRFKVKYKFLTILLLSVLGSLTLTGVWLSYYIDDYETAYNQRKIDENFLAISNSMIDFKNRLTTQARQFSSNSELIASVHLISRYEDQEKYQNIIFDQEKRSLLDKLHSMLSVTDRTSVRIYDARKNLIVYTQIKDQSKGYISYQNKQPVMMEYNEYQRIWTQASISDYASIYQLNKQRRDFSPSFTLVDGNVITIDYVRPLERHFSAGKTETVGYIAVSVMLDNTELNKLSTVMQLDFYPRRMFYSTFGGSKKALLDDSCPDVFSKVDEFNVSSTFVFDDRLYSFRRLISDDSVDYLALSVNYSLISERIHNIQIILGLLLVFSALLVVPLALYISRVYFTRPIEQLVHLADSLRAGDYSQRVEITTQDEFQILASAFTEAFQVIDKRERGYLELHAQLEDKVEKRTLSLQAENAERRKAEQMLLYSKTLLQLVIDTIPQYIYWKDMQGRYLGCNLQYARFLGYEDTAALHNKTDVELMLDRPDMHSIQKTEALVTRTNTAVVHDMHTISTASGELIYFETNHIPLHESDGQVIGLLGTYDDVTKRMAFEHALIDAKEQAELASRSKSEFLSRTSHELRTPLNAILGFAQLLEMDEVIEANNEYREWVGEIVHAGNHLLELINEVLDLSSIESGRETLKLTELNLDSALRKSLAIVSSMASASGITIDVDIGTDLQVMADELKLTQVLVNLLSNAIKYNRLHGQVNISARRLGTQLQITIADTGEGISKSELGKLFSPFERLDKLYSGIEGTGIGLALSKRLMLAMGGDIGVESEPGVGSRFWIMLPIANA